MLFNYPKSDISKFHDEINEKVDLPDTSDLRKRRPSVYNPNVMESVADIRGYIGNPLVFEKHIPSSIDPHKIIQEQTDGLVL